MTEEDIRRIAREEAKRVLREHIAWRRRERERRDELEQKIHEDALEAAHGAHGQD
jgi:hypothetical protein